MALRRILSPFCFLRFRGIFPLPPAVMSSLPSDVVEKLDGSSSGPCQKTIDRHTAKAAQVGHAFLREEVEEYIASTPAETPLLLWYSSDGRCFRTKEVLIDQAGVRDNKRASTELLMERLMVARAQDDGPSFRALLCEGREMQSKTVPTIFAACAEHPSMHPRGLGFTGCVSSVLCLDKGSNQHRLLAKLLRLWKRYLYAQREGVAEESEEDRGGLLELELREAEICIPCVDHGTHGSAEKSLVFLVWTIGGKAGLSKLWVVADKLIDGSCALFREIHRLVSWGDIQFISEGDYDTDLMTEFLILFKVDSSLLGGILYLGLSFNGQGFTLFEKFRDSADARGLAVSCLRGLYEFIKFALTRWMLVGDCCSVLTLASVFGLSHLVRSASANQSAAAWGLDAFKLFRADLRRYVVYAYLSTLPANSVLQLFLIDDRCFRNIEEARILFMRSRGDIFNVSPKLWGFLYKGMSMGPEDPEVGGLRLFRDVVAGVNRSFGYWYGIVYREFLQYPHCLGVWDPNSADSPRTQVANKVAAFAAKSFDELGGTHLDFTTQKLHELASGDPGENGLEESPGFRDAVSMCRSWSFAPCSSKLTEEALGSMVSASKAHPSWSLDHVKSAGFDRQFQAIKKNLVAVHKKLERLRKKRDRLRAYNPAKISTVYGAKESAAEHHSEQEGRSLSLEENAGIQQHIGQTLRSGSAVDRRDWEKRRDAKRAEKTSEKTKDLINAQVQIGELESAIERTRNAPVGCLRDDSAQMKLSSVKYPPEYIIDRFEKLWGVGQYSCRMVEVARRAENPPGAAQVDHLRDVFLPEEAPDRVMASWSQEIWRQRSVLESRALIVESAASGSETVYVFSYAAGNVTEYEAELLRPVEVAELDGISSTFSFFQVHCARSLRT